MGNIHNHVEHNCEKKAQSSRVIHSLHNLQLIQLGIENIFENVCGEEKNIFFNQILCEYESVKYICVFTHSFLYRALVHAN